MLRVGFIFSILFALMAYALRGPVEALVLYLWLAYFRPENWVWTPFIRTLPLSLLALPVYVQVPQLYAGTLGLSLGRVGAILLAARLLDAFADPLLGHWMDKVASVRGHAGFVLMSLLPMAAVVREGRCGGRQRQAGSAARHQRQVSSSSGSATGQEGAHGA